MDARVKPGHDEAKATAADSAAYPRALVLFARIANRSDHLAPSGDFAPEVVARLADRLDRHVEADGLELLLRLRLLHDGIDLRIELGDDRIRRLRRREEADPGAGIDIGESHLA